MPNIKIKDDGGQKVGGNTGVILTNQSLNDIASNPPIVEKKQQLTELQSVVEKTNFPSNSSEIGNISSNHNEKQGQGAQSKVSDFLTDMSEIRSIDDDHGFVGRRDSAEQILEVIRGELESFLITLDMSGSIKARLVPILLSCIKGIRNSIDTKDMLMRSVDQNGFGFDSSITSALLGFIVDQKTRFNELHGTVDRIIPSSTALDTLKKNDEVIQTYDLVGSSIQSKTLDTNNVSDKKLSGLEKLRKSYGEEGYNVNNLKVGLEKAPHGSQVVSPVVDLLNKQPIKNATINSAQGKIKSGVSYSSKIVSLTPPTNPVLIRKDSPGVSMVDVLDPKIAMTGGVIEMKKQGATIDTRSLRLIGPVDELRLMGLDEFKRISVEVRARIGKIMEKFALLEERSYLERIKGVEAWRSSGVYSLYVEMGYEALLQEKDLKRIIDERFDKKIPFLSLEEFYAVGEVNKSLMF